MYASRREFLRSAGIFLSAMVLARVPGLPEVDKFWMDSPHHRVRLAWLELQKTGLHKGRRAARGQKDLHKQLTYHNLALDELVSSGGLDKEAAHQVRAAFRAAVLHTRCIGLTWCTGLLGSVPKSSPHSTVEFTAASQLIRQTGILAGMAAAGVPAAGTHAAGTHAAGSPAGRVFSPETAAEARRVISRAMAILTTPQKEPPELYGPHHPTAGCCPPFEELSLRVSPASQAAARFLGDLLSIGKSG